MNRARASWRLFSVVAHALWGLAQILILFPGLAQPLRDQRVQHWARGMLDCLGVGLRIRGTPAPSGPVLLVANHVSWLDILVLLAARHCRFVSKSDVRHWPLIGLLATGAGTLYVERASRRDAMRVVHQMAQALQDGGILAVFPEGTTGDGQALLPFHANLIQAAISAPAPVQAVALRFIDGDSGAPSRAMSYVGDESLPGSLWRTLVAPNICALLVYGVPAFAQGRDRRGWAHALRQEIAEMLEP